MRLELGTRRRLNMPAAEDGWATDQHMEFIRNLVKRTPEEEDAERAARERMERFVASIPVLEYRS